MSSQDQPQDQPPDAEEPEDERPDDERLAGLTEHIEKARSQAEEAGVLVDADEEEHYADSGDTRAADDQTIVPPG